MSKQLNRTINWDDMNPEGYRQAYFDPPSDEDRWVWERYAAALRTYSTPGSITRAAEIGCGPNLAAALLCAPYLRKNGHIELIDAGAQNIAYLQAILTDEERLVHDWRSALHVIGEYPAILPTHQIATHILMRQARIHQAYVQDVVKQIRNKKAEPYDALSTLFVAESVTESEDEAEELIGMTLETLKEGGIFFGAYVECSESWTDRSEITTDGTPPMELPAVSINSKWLQRQFRGTHITVERCNLKPALRKGYKGILVAAGTK